MSDSLPRTYAHEKLAQHSAIPQPGKSLWCGAQTQRICQSTLAGCAALPFHSGCGSADRKQSPLLLAGAPQSQCACVSDSVTGCGDATPEELKLLTAQVMMSHCFGGLQLPVIELEGDKMSRRDSFVYWPCFGGCFSLILCTTRH